MGYTLSRTNTARKQLQKLPVKVQRLIEEKLEKLAENPHSAALDIKKLTGRDAYRLRVGDYRIIYTLDHGQLVIHVIAVAHRKRIYD